MDNFSEITSFIWQIADLLRGPYRPNQYKDIMLPLTVLRRLDCVLEPTKDAVLSEFEKLKDKKENLAHELIKSKLDIPFCNTSKYTFEKLKGDPDNLDSNLVHYMKSFSREVREIIGHFDFEKHIDKLKKSNRLYHVVTKFSEIDLHPDKVSNVQMGYIFEELIRKFNEQANEEAGDHFTPREVIKLMVSLIFDSEHDLITAERAIRTIYDPVCGTGGMLSESLKHVAELNPDAQLYLFGQDYNAQAYAVCGSDMLIKGQDIENIRYGDSFTEDHFPDKKFDFMLANPPFGVEWKPEEEFIRKEHEEKGDLGRFGPGLPRINDGSLLFLLHMISKMKLEKEGGSRMVIVFNGSPLFTGGAGSGESEIRKHIIEMDYLEAVIALPDQLFYNTGIYTYLWILSNKKTPGRKGKVQLIDARTQFKKMRKSLGQKRHEICDDQKDEIVTLYSDLEESEHVKIFNGSDFGYRRVTVERPLKLSFEVNDERLEKLRAEKAFIKLAESKKKDKKEQEKDIKKGQELQEKIINVIAPLGGHGVIKNRDEFSKLLKETLKKNELDVAATLFKKILMSLSVRDESADVCCDKKGNPEPDGELRDYENIPLSEDVETYMKREVLPHVPDAWIDESKTKVGYEINFNRYFYKYTPPRPLEEIEADIKTIEADIAGLLKGLL